MFVFLCSGLGCSKSIKNQRRNCHMFVSLLWDLLKTFQNGIWATIVCLPLFDCSKAVQKVFKHRVFRISFSLSLSLSICSRFCSKSSKTTHTKLNVCLPLPRTSNTQSGIRLRYVSFSLHQDLLKTFQIASAEVRCLSASVWLLKKRSSSTLICWYLFSFSLYLSLCARFSKSFKFWVATWMFVCLCRGP